MHVLVCCWWLGWGSCARARPDPSTKQQHLPTHIICMCCCVGGGSGDGRARARPDPSPKRQHPTTYYIICMCCCVGGGSGGGSSAFDCLRLFCWRLQPCRKAVSSIPPVLYLFARSAEAYEHHDDACRERAVVSHMIGILRVHVCVCECVMCCHLHRIHLVIVCSLCVATCVCV